MLHQRENRGGRPDPESQGEDSYSGETGGLAQYAQTIVQVLNQRPHTVSCLCAKEHVGAMLSQEMHFTPAVPLVPDGWSATLPLLGWLVYVAAVLTMMLITLLASALPATRAASADPIQALRSV